MLFIVFLVLISAKISLGRTMTSYKSEDPIYLSFEVGDIVEVLSKSAGNRMDLWGGRVSTCTSLPWVKPEI